jgi:hypothetical protein
MSNRSKYGQNLKMVKCQSGQIPLARDRHLESFLKWSNRKIGQTGQMSKWSNWQMLNWSNPVGAYSGLIEISHNCKVVEQVKFETGKMSNRSKFGTGQNLKLVKLVKQRSSQIPLEIIRN